MAMNSSTSAGGLPRCFDNATTKERYYNVVATKHIWEEQGFKFDDGLDFYGLEMVIAKELSEACHSDKAILAYPCLISTLYRRAAAPSHSSDKYTHFRSG
ncbi:hypothetical protein V6N13_124245 [Hibiscus sabdariffa]|uniref:Uncharacterized protein n=1 Tax=Hibiscus sabdariffa TaxID=183260 RepID=A0ABR2S0X5_9ROSI